MKNKLNMLYIAILSLIAGCCKHRPDENPCIANQFNIYAITERYSDFWCTGNNEYTYILRSKSQIDSLSNCYFSPPAPFPVDETNMLYLMVGRMSYHYKDTFETFLYKDTCNRRLTYTVNMLQRDTAFNCCPYGIGAVSSMFCSVENIPADYQVEVKYKYVPIQ